MISSSRALKSAPLFRIHISISLQDPASPPEVNGDVNEDVLLQGLENSPMFSVYDDCPTPLSSDLETSLSSSPSDFLDTLDFITDPLADIPLKSSHGSGLFMDLLSEDIFLNNPNLLNGVNIQGE